MKYINPFKSKLPKDNNIIKLIGLSTLINYIDNNGGERTCLLSEYKNEKYSTHKIEDITRLYLYNENDELLYIIRIKSKYIIDQRTEKKLTLDDSQIINIYNQLKSLI